MKGRLAQIMAMSAMFAGMAGMDMPSLGGRRREYKSPEMPPLKHTGDIPKGCKVENHELVFIKEQRDEKYKITVFIETCAGTVKATIKKRQKIANQIQAFIEHCHIDALMRKELYGTEGLIIYKIEEPLTNTTHEETQQG